MDATTPAPFSRPPCSLNKRTPKDGSAIRSARARCETTPRRCASRSAARIS
jgi:hypothetical protein